MAASRSRWRPSELEKLELCPAFAGSAVETDASAEGTRLHEAMEYRFPRHSKMPKRLTSRLKDSHYELLDRAEVMVRRAVGDRRCTYRKELPVNITNFRGARCRGTLDLVAEFEDGDALVLDYKFGRIPVSDAEDNLQVLAYAVGFFNASPKTHRVVVGVAQPHVSDTCSLTCVTPDRVPEIISRICAVVNNVRNNPEPSGNFYACTYCARKLTCPKVTGPIATIAGQFTGFEVPQKYMPGPDTTVEQRNTAQHLAKVFEDWGRMWKQSNLEAVLEDGLELPDFALTSRAGSPQVLDNLALARALKDCGATLEDLLSVARVPFGQLMSVLEEKGVELSREVIEDELETAGIITVSEGSTFLRKKPRTSLAGYLRSKEEEGQQ